MRTVAVIGCGRISHSAHFPALSKIEGVRIKYACDLIEEKALKAKEMYPLVENVITDYKIALADPEVDAVGACIGNKGARINTVVNELNGEKIDIIPYSDDVCEYVKAALSPATVIDVELVGERQTRATVSPDQLSLAIGKMGQNARLAARLTGCKIDIKSE